MKSKAILHFHEEAAGLIADVRPTTIVDVDRIKVDDPEGRARVP